MSRPIPPSAFEEHGGRTLVCHDTTRPTELDWSVTLANTAKHGTDRCVTLARLKQSSFYWVEEGVRVVEEGLEDRPSVIVPIDGTTVAYKQWEFSCKVDADENYRRWINYPMFTTVARAPS